MHFIFGYAREVPVKMEKETSLVALITVAILVVLLFIFLSFEDIDGETISSYLSFQASSGLTQIGVVGKLENNCGIHPEQNFWIHFKGDLNSKNSSRLWRDSQSQ